MKMALVGTAGSEDGRSGLWLIQEDDRQECWGEEGQAG